MPTRKIVTLVVICGAITVSAALVLTYFTSGKSSIKYADDGRNSNLSSSLSAVSGVRQNDSRTTLAQQWQTLPVNTQTLNKADDEQEFTSFGIKVTEIYHAIGEIEIDANGVIIDSRTRRLLEEAVEQLGPNLTDHDLNEIEQLLLESLPEPYGQEASRVLNDFYSFKKAEAKLAEQPIANKSGQFNNLVTLRRQHLGDKLANQLYGNEEALHRYLSANQKIHADKNLTPEQKEEQLKSIKSDLQSGYLHIDSSDNQNIQQLKQDVSSLSARGASEEFISEVHNQSVTIIAAQQAVRDPVKARDFDQRLQQFNREREYILSAGLVEADKLAQLNTLMHKYFSAQELAQAEYYQPVGD